MNILTSLDIERFWDKVDKNGQGGCFVWLGSKDGNGYGKIKLQGDKTPSLAHRVAYMIAHPEDDIEGWLICHTCDNTCCTNWEHLFKGTQKDNLQDMTNKGRRVTSNHFGENNPKHKLTLEQVEEIKELLGYGIVMRELANSFGVSISAINHIKRGSSWG